MPVFQDVLKLIFTDTDPIRLEKQLAEFNASVIEGDETRKRPNELVEKQGLKVKHDSDPSG